MCKSSKKEQNDHYNKYQIMKIILAFFIKKLETLVP